MEMIVSLQLTSDLFWILSVRLRCLKSDYKETSTFLAHTQIGQEGPKKEEKSDDKIVLSCQVDLLSPILKYNKFTLTLTFFPGLFTWTRPASSWKIILNNSSLKTASSMLKLKTLTKSASLTSISPTNSGCFHQTVLVLHQGFAGKEFNWVPTETLQHNLYIIMISK